MSSVPDMTARISLAMMVCDEEAKIGGALKSAAPWVDEMVIVDFGSKDRTVEIAKDLGAHVHRGVWLDSFSRARNETLKYCTGDFALVLDADERIRGNGVELLRKHIDEHRDELPPHVVFSANVINIEADGNVLSEVWQPRLITLDSRLRYRRRIHNELCLLPNGEVLPPGAINVIPSFNAQGFEIVHWGYDPDLYAARRKRERAFRLLAMEMAERPDDLATHFYLGRELAFDDQIDKAEVHLRRVVEEGTDDQAQLREMAALYLDKYCKEVTT